MTKHAEAIATLQKAIKHTAAGDGPDSLEAGIAYHEGAAKELKALLVKRDQDVALLEAAIKVLQADEGYPDAKKAA